MDQGLRYREHVAGKADKAFKAALALKRLQGLRPSSMRQPEKVLDRPDQIRGRIWSGRSYWTRSLGRSGRFRPVPDRSGRDWSLV